jgi:hypothetical protein
MKSPITKRKVSITLSEEVSIFLDNNFENKSKYIEYLIYKNIHECGLMKKEIII